MHINWHVCVNRVIQFITEMQFVGFFLLAIIGNHVVRSAYVQVSPGEALQNYLCNGSLLRSNTTILLIPGEHLISSGQFCSIFNVSNVSITGSSREDTTIRCQGNGGLGFIFARHLIIEGITLVGCGQTTNLEGRISVTLLFQLSLNVSIQHCTFQNNNASYTVRVQSSWMVDIVSCVFQNNTNTEEDGGAILVEDSTSITITDCTFRGSRFSWYVINALYSYIVSVSACIFHDVVAGVGVIYLRALDNSTRITGCSFEAVRSKAVIYFNPNTSGSASGVHITDCTFQNNFVDLGQVFNPAFVLGSDIILFNCTFRGDLNPDSSAVLSISYSGSLSITDCKFTDSSYSLLGAIFGVHYEQVYVTISGCLFQNMKKENLAIVALQGNAHTSIINCTFLEIEIAVYGASVAFLLSGFNNVHIYITNCTFQDMRSSGFMATAIRFANLLVEENSDAHIRACKFKNNALGAGHVIVSDTDSPVYITDCIFQNNSGYYGVLYLLGTTHIHNCTFLDNIGKQGGAIQIIMPNISTATIKDCTFYNNSALFGGAISIISSGTVLVTSSSFIRNNAVVGAAINARSNRPEATSVLFLCTLSLVDVIIKENFCSCDDYNETRGGAMYFSGVNVIIVGSSDRGSQIISNSPQGAIQGLDVFLQLRGKILFYNNTGENGGAISLLNNVQLIFHNNCMVTFVGNRATRFGGAIYIEGEEKRLATKTDNDIEIYSYCVLTFHDDNDITFQDNHAALTGHAIYATPLYHCHNSKWILEKLNNHSVANYGTSNLADLLQMGSLLSYQEQFTIFPSPGDSNSSQIVSFPTNVIICSFKEKTDFYHGGQYSIQTYPGRIMQMNLSSVDYANVFTPSAVYAQITTGTSSTTSQTIRLGDQQNVQWIGGECSTVEYQIYGPENTSLNLLLSSYPGNAPTIIQVTLLPCLIGFTLVSDKCICSEFFTSLGMVCDTARGTVTREGTNWIGVYHDRKEPVPALASTCPLNYCKIADTVSLIRPGDLCNGGRTGTLCGSCSDGQSVVFGSSQCQVCSDEWLITILMYAVLGASLVAVLFILNITVTQGTLYGLIFYANIIQVNASIFFNQSALRPFQVMISLINLDLGLPLCFYHGMDDIAKTGLQFVFPTYLLTLTIIIIVLCHYCLRHSTQNNHWFDKPMYIVGQRAVGVLSTLIYLSYSKVLRTVIDIFTFSTLHFPQGSELIWFYDGNIKYLHGRHIVLFVIAMAMCIVFLLPYTLALTFIPFIERYNEQNRLFNYLHKQTNRIKPMNDAYYAPYKGEWRFWLGARLWLLVFIYSLNPVYGSDQPSLLLLIHAIVVTVFMLVQSEVKPFGESIQATDRHCRKIQVSNEFYNWIDLFYLLNYIALTQSVSYILYHDSHPTQKNTLDIAVGVLVGMYVVVLMTTISYHFIVTILKVCNKYDTIKEKVNNLMFPTQIQYQPIELEEPADDDDDDGDYSNLREPLSERL